MTARLKIFVCLHSWYYFKNFSAVFERLHGDGHKLTIVALNEDRDDFQQAVDAFRDSHPGLEIAMAPARRDGWALLCWCLRQTIGFLHFMDPRFDETPRLRERIEKRTAEKLRSLVEAPKYRSRVYRGLLGWVLRRLERAIPPNQEISAFVREYAPDVMILSPLIDLDGAQWDYLKSAKALGIPTIFPVYSWDNLSSKTHLFARPDRILVWNRRQVEEAARYHRIPRQMIGVTGAQSFDEWFSRQPSRDKAAFCGDLELDPAQALILYVASATTRRDLPESDFTRRWLTALRGAEDARVRSAQVVIRPHPKREHIWRDFLEQADAGVKIHPAEGQLPIGEEAKRLYFDSLHHCDLVVGLNTSALIEAGIVGRPVFTVLDPAFAVDQTETFHFHYLLDASEGLLSVAKDFDQHLSQIAVALENPAPAQARARDFVRSFIRPKGEDVEAVPRFIEEVLTTARLRRPEKSDGLLDRLLRRRMAPFVFNQKHLWFQGGKLKKFGRVRDREPQDSPAE